MTNGSVNGNTNGQINPVGKSALQAEQERLQMALAKRMAEDAKENGTQRLTGRTLDSVKPETFFSSGLRYGSANDYAVLPVRLAGKVNLDEVARWRIELHGLDGSAGPKGFDLVGDVVIGRGKEGPAAPDVDLDPFSAQKLGVSRRHVILRPTEKHLYLIDLNSTNGTMHNGVPVGPGVARSLQHNDTIMIGDLTFTLKIIASPNNVTNRPNPETMTVVDLLNHENARKAAESPKNSTDMTRRMLHALSVPPPPKFSAMPSTDHNADTPPRPIPSSELLSRQPISGEPDKDQPADAASQPKAAPAKPAKIMGLRSRLNKPNANHK